MPDHRNIVAIGLLTAPEFERWGSSLQNVYEVSGISGFEDLLEAIDRADAAHKREEALTPAHGNAQKATE